jgi:hypothetical protein
MLASGAAAAGDAPGRLESVSILAARSGSSLALRMSSSATLVTATASDPGTVVIELVGIVAERGDTRVNDGGMISHIAIETTGLMENRPVTRIRVSFVKPFRHRVRISGSLVYVDFENIETVSAPVVAARQPAIPKRPPQVPAAKSLSRPGPVPDAVTVSRPPAPDTTPEVSLLARWLAIAEPLQHTSSPPSSATVLARAWIPIVLKDGTVIFSYGDYAEVNDQFVFSLPFDDDDAPRAAPVTVPRSAVDVDATRHAAESVRAARYTLTRGPREFAEISDEVSAILNTVPSNADPVARVKIVEGARRRLMEWPASHYGYRSSDVNELVSMLDPILGQFRAAAGVNRVDLSLTAPPSAAPPPAVTFRQPTLIDLIENAMRLVPVLNASVDRTAVLRLTADSLARHQSELPGVWFTTGQRRVAAALKSETDLDVAYRKLSTDIISKAARKAGEGDVRAISALRSDLTERDRRLGGQRPDVLVSTMAALMRQFDAAAQVRLSRDRQTVLGDAVRTYANEIQPALKRFDGLERDLRRISEHSDEPASSSKMAALREGVELVKRRLAECPPPEAAAQGHGLLVTAAHLAGVAVQETVDPRLSPDTAMNVRAIAATESLAMFDRGRQAIEAALRPASGH